MLEALRKLLRGGAKPERHFEGDDPRLALAALLVHCTSVDGAVSGAEQTRLAAILSQSFGLAAADLQLLLADAVEAERESVDLYRFTSILKRQMSQEDRIRVVEDLWAIVYADGASHEFEENLVWRVAELLGVSREDRIAKKRAAAENRSNQASDD